MSIAGVVLAGGQSRRMGSDKAQLKIGNQSLLDHAQIILANAGIKDIYISGKQGLVDQFHNKGPLSGILSSLISLQQFAYIVFIPVDMPFLTKELIQELISNHYSAIHFEGNNLPLMIKNTLEIREILLNQINNNHLSIYGFLNELGTESLKHNYDKDIFINTNSPLEWENAIRKLQEQ